VERRAHPGRVDLDGSLAVPAGEPLALVGPSAAGKATALRAIAGLFRPDRGRIGVGPGVLLDTAAGVDVPPEARRVGFVYQDGALFPFLSVVANVAYGVRAGRRRDRERAAREVLDRFGIGHLAAAGPGDLSGGERPRVALARAVASDPEVL